MKPNKLRPPQSRLAAAHCAHTSLDGGKRSRSILIGKNSKRDQTNQISSGYWNTSLSALIRKHIQMFYLLPRNGNLLKDILYL